MLKQLLLPTVTVIFVVFLIWISIRTLANPNRNMNFRTEMILLMLAVYSACVVVLTLYPLPMYKNWNLHEVNVVPIVGSVKLYQSVRLAENGLLESYFLNIFGNICLFVPFGVLLPQLNMVFRSLKNFFVVVLLFSMFIEILQFVFRGFGIYRTVDVDDVILNTLGGLIGFGILKLAKRST